MLAAAAAGGVGAAVLVWLMDGGTEEPPPPPTPAVQAAAAPPPAAPEAPQPRGERARLPWEDAPVEADEDRDLDPVFRHAQTDPRRWEKLAERLDEYGDPIVSDQAREIARRVKGAAALDEAALAALVRDERSVLREIARRRPGAAPTLQQLLGESLDAIEESAKDSG